GTVMSNVDTHGQVQFERHEAGPVDLEVMTCQPVSLEVGPHLRLERIVHRRPADAIDGHEDGVPAARPPEHRGGALNTGTLLRTLRVVLRRDRPRLAAEGH